MAAVAGGPIKSGHASGSLRILFLAKRRYTNKDALTERFGRAYRFPMQWATAGHEVELVLLDYRSMSPASACDDGFPVRSLPAADPRTLFRVRRAASRLRPDVVVAAGDCFVGLAGLHAARQAGARFVFDVYDDYASFGSHRAFLGWDALSYLRDRADLVLYASRSLAGHHGAASPWMLAPNGVDPDAFHPRSMAEARARVGLSGNQRLVGYFGSMEPDRGVDDLVDAAGRLQASHPGLRLLLCGTRNADMPPLPPWVDFRGVVPHADIPDYISACDVVALPYRRSRVMDMGASCKIAEYLLCERPLVATATPNFTANFPVQAEALGDASCRPGDPADLARALALQLDRRRLVPPPLDLTWQAIAASIADALQRLPAPRR